MRTSLAGNEIFRTFAIHYMVDVVQLVEHRIVVPSVVGSSPIIHPKESIHCLKIQFIDFEAVLFLAHFSGYL